MEKKLEEVGDRGSGERKERVQRLTTPVQERRRRETTDRKEGEGEVLGREQEKKELKKSFLLGRRR